MRVAKNAQFLGKKEGADLIVLFLASLLHDSISKSNNSDLSRDSMVKLLKDNGVSDDVLNKVIYAIDVHSFSKGINPETLEAKILQDADRLDALGAIGIARVFMTGGSLGRAFYSDQDPFCSIREPDDQKWNLDHFKKKLLKLESGMHTITAKKVAARRTRILVEYLENLEKELQMGDVDE
jgi:uncharacterized protein